MNHAARMGSNQPSSSPYAMTISKTKVQEMTSRPSFASRMIRLVFKRKQRSMDTERAKSWPGCAEPVTELEPTFVKSHPSATIAIPNSLTSSASSKVPTTFTSPHRVRQYAVDDSESEASWRQRQTHCANCERLFFKSMSSLSNAAGRFCSLDCKANFEYLTQLQETMNMEMMADTIASRGLFDEIEDEGRRL
ncbi:hypothetical protein GN958_ATG12238 [Phytophthora infestans]|uniref:FLZ-type domain-containing protein n=1 Tax=Phytophthora infestans TaxID=4787 RepID=A0A8S9UDC3_PHYIN|nr:hypothetical protein GN958_ATG12238 [Phytophthora infestans]